MQRSTERLTVREWGSLSLSLALHVLTVGALSTVSHYDFDFEVKMPSEIEFGIDSEMTLAANQAIASADTVTDPAAVPESESESVTDAVADAGTVADSGADAGAGAVAGAGAGADAGADAGTDSGVLAESVLEGPSRIPPGAHMALRIDMARVRSSSVAEDVQRLLAAIPDWQLILADSGIDPVRDLDRLLIASPNLQRSKLVLAGKHSGGPTFAQGRVAELAKARQKYARWKKRHGVPVAPWFNRDVTPRVIGLLDEQHFTISTSRDLPRVLAFAQERSNKTDDKVNRPQALLSMGPNEAVTIEIQGVHRFVIGQIRNLPTSVVAAIEEQHSNRITARARATYPSEASAERAVSYWERVRDHYGRMPLLALAGVAAPIRKMRFATEARELRVDTELSTQQMRMVLGFLEGLVGGGVPNAPVDPPKTKKGPR